MKAIQLGLLSTLVGDVFNQSISVPQTTGHRATKKYACKRKNVKYKHKVRPVGSNKKRAIGLRYECKK